MRTSVRARARVCVTFSVGVKVRVEPNPESHRLQVLVGTHEGDSSYYKGEHTKWAPSMPKDIPIAK